MTASRTGSASTAQQRMWLTDELAEDPALNHIPVLYQASGPVRVSDLELALNRLVERHDALRTGVMLGPDGLEQVPSCASISVLRRDLHGSSESGLRAELLELAKAPFDVQRGPLFRCAVLASPAGEHYILLVFHHICIDDWSLRLALNEVWQDYAGLAEGQPADHPAGGGSYRAYPAREQRWLASPEAQQVLRAMVRTLSGFEGQIALPGTPRAGSAARAGHGGVVQARLESADVAALGRRAKRARCSLFTLMLATYAALLHRICGQRRYLVMIVRSPQQRRGPFRVIRKSAGSTSGSSVPAEVAIAQERVHCPLPRPGANVVALQTILS